jgi:hypothetical protein
MERVVDFLAVEIEREEKLKAKRECRKDGKHDRIESMLTAGLRTIEPQPMSLDLLRDQNNVPPRSFFQKRG